MDSRPRGHPAREGEQAPRPKLKQMLLRFMGLTSKKRPPYQGPPQSSDPQAPGIHEMPDNQQIPSHPQASRRPAGLNYPVTQGQDYGDVLAAPPVNAARHSPQPPQESRQQAHTIPPEAIPGTEIIIALMGVTGKIQSLFEPIYVG